MADSVANAPAPVMVPSSGKSTLDSILSGFPEMLAEARAEDKKRDDYIAESDKKLQGFEDQATSVMQKIADSTTAMRKEEQDLTNNAPAEPNDDPMHRFGSAASVLAIFGSLLTRAPLTSALNASAAAMNALKKNDWDTYNANYNTWKTQTDNAIKLHQLELEAYNSALSKIGTDINATRAEMTAHASALNHSAMMDTLKWGGALAGKELASSLKTAGDGLTTAKMRAEIVHTDMAIQQLKSQGLTDTDPQIIDLQSQKEALQQGLEDAGIRTGLSAPTEKLGAPKMIEYTGSDGKPVQVLASYDSKGNQWVNTSTGEPLPRGANIRTVSTTGVGNPQTVDYTDADGQVARATAIYDKNARQWIDTSTNTPIPGGDKVQIVPAGVVTAENAPRMDSPKTIEYTGADGKPTRATAGFVKQGAGGYWVDTSTNKPIPAGSTVKVIPTGVVVSEMESPAMTDDQVATAAITAATGDKMTDVIQGWGPTANANRLRVYNAAIDRIQKETGLSHEDAAKLFAYRQVTYKAGTMSTEQLTKMLGATQQITKQLEFNINRANDDMQRVSTSDLNKVVNAMAEGLDAWNGDPALSSLYLDLTAVTDEATRILSGGQASAAQLHAGMIEQSSSWITNHITPASFKDLSKTLLAEGNRRIQTYNDAISYMRDNMLGTVGSPQPADKYVPGKTYIDGQGNKSIYLGNGNWGDAP